MKITLDASVETAMVSFVEVRSTSGDDSGSAPRRVEIDVPDVIVTMQYPGSGLSQTKQNKTQ